MDGIEHEEDDPFLWDVGAVSKVLCSPGRPWARDPVGLAQKIDEEEMNGKTLLTFEHTFSRKELMTCLGIKPARQMAALVEEIIGLQSRSKGFRAWKRNVSKQLSLQDLLDDEPQPPGGASVQGALTRLLYRIDPVQSTSDYVEASAIRDGRLEDQADLQPLTPTESNSVLASEPSGEPSGEEANGTRDSENLRQSNRVLDNDAHHANTSTLQQSDHEDVPDRDERPPKRRRIEPINLSLQPLADHQLAAPGFQVPDPSREPVSEVHYGAYLGSHPLNKFAVQSHVGPADPQIIELPDSSFATTASILLPRGQRIWVAGLMKKLLRKNCRQERLLRLGLRPLSSSNDDEELFDLSDLPEEWDEETFREIEEEKAENAARERELARCLSQERVEAILLEALDKMTSRWEEEKLPRYQTKAYGIWMDAARRGRKLKIIHAQQDVNRCEARIKNIMAEILKDKWQCEKDVQNQARIMEQNVDDKLHNMWLISLLESRVQPERPLKVARVRKIKPQTSLFDDEVLTSDDDMDFFIVNDDKKQQMQQNEPSIGNGAEFEASRPSTPLDQMDEDIVVLDLTQLDTPENASDSQTLAELIDLTTPQKTQDVTPSKSSRQRDAAEMEDPPSISELEDVEAIVRHSATHWARQKDRWRLIICMIYRLGHARRQSMFGLLQGNSIEDVWDKSINLQLTQPIKDQSQLEKAEAERLLAFDVTRIFFSFVKCRQINEARIVDVDNKMRRALMSNKDVIFPNFCSFVEGMAPQYPQDSQILRVDDIDDVEMDELPDEKGPSTSRRRVAREVVQNKEALEMREREKRRIEEQQARSLKLRAEMAKSTAITSDQSRLIINESKQEDQDFVYVNSRIGRDIKDHQINGVRFLWNQIIRDADVRQGCLLAHTMGLGKTMQAITFLVAIAEAAASEEISVRTQIPDDLRSLKVLVLCPAGLVDNWVDEVLIWAPEGLLGSIRKIESSMNKLHRFTSVRDWAREGGLLIIGYDMLKGICKSNEPDIEKLLLNTPNIVIADEAHYLKSPNTQVHQVCARFQTRSRIALTGTPLSNNVEEYYSMINWVAPNFLGPSKEFNETYATPIYRGLWSDSGSSEKREALKMLEALKRTVAPKIDRATISCIKGFLPSKLEFVLFVAPTPLQKKLYNMYVTAVQMQPSTQASIFSVLHKLTLICNHPRCFQAAVEDARKHPAKMNDSLLTQEVLDAIHKETKAQDMDDPRLSQKVELLMIILDEAREAKDKVLVFSQSIPTLNYLENLFQMQRRRVSRLDGSTKIGSRQEDIKSFNRGDKEVYLISTKAGGVGLNIPGANRVVIFDLKWNPVVDQQAIGRAYRIGQQKTVYVYHFLLAGSFEQVLHNKSVFKMQLASRLVDEKNPVSWGKRHGDLETMQDVASRDLSPFIKFDTILKKLIGYKPHGEGIKEIVSTDTFEEEDKDSEVTPELKEEIEEVVMMHQLRLSDPEKYNKLLEQKQSAGLALHHQHQYQGGPLRPSSTSGSHPNGVSNVSQSLDGANDYQFYIPSQLPSHAGPGSSVQTDPSLPRIPVPPPIAGANTYFRETESAPTTVPTLAPPATPAAGRIPGLGLEPREAGPMPAPYLKGGIFGPPQSQAKDEFEKKLSEKLDRVQDTLLAQMFREDGSTAGSVTMEIADLLKEQAQGFLNDNARWSLLSKYMDNNRFFTAVISGFLGPSVLALARTDELEGRVALLNSLSKREMRERFERKKRPDPSNLDNIGKPPHARSTRAIEDLEVMKKTADNRAQRGIRLPSWGYEALARNSSEGPSWGPERA